MLYEEKLAIANAYLEKHSGLGWNNFSDINSLHDCDTQEDIIAACNERLEEDGYPMDLLEEDDQYTEIEDEEEPEVIEELEIVEDNEEDDDSCIAYGEDYL